MSGASPDELGRFSFHELVGALQQQHERMMEELVVLRKAKDGHLGVGEECCEERQSTERPATHMISPDGPCHPRRNVISLDGPDPPTRHVISLDDGEEDSPGFGTERTDPGQHHRSLQSLHASQGSSRLSDDLVGNSMLLERPGEDDVADGSVSTTEESGVTAMIPRTRTAQSLDSLPLCPVWTSCVNMPSTSSKTRKVRTLTRGLSKKVVCGGDTIRDPSSPLQWCVLSPNSWARLCWEFLSVLVLTYDLVAIPLSAFQRSESEWSLMVSCLISSFWSLDILLNFFSGYHNVGILEMRPRFIARRYLRSWLPFDVFVVLLDWVLFLVRSVRDLVGIMRAGKLARLARLLRMLRLVRAIKMSRLMDSIMDNCQSESLLTCIGIVKAVMVIGTLNHFVACLWFAIGNWSSGPRWTDEVESEPILHQYAVSLHWSLTQFTPASMEVVPVNAVERVFNVLVIVFALVTFGSFVSFITGSMAHVQRINQARSEEKENIRRYTIDNKVSLDLTARISAYVRAYKFTPRRRVHEADITSFRSLPTTLVMQLRWEVYGQQLVCHPFFQAIKEDIELRPAIVEICHDAMSEISVVTSQELFTPSAFATRMLFFVSGALVYSKDCSEADTYVIKPTSISETPGLKQLSLRWLAEVALWISKYQHVGTLRALAPSELYAMDVGIFRMIASQRCPELHEPCRRYAVLFRDALCAGEFQDLEIEAEIEVAGLQELTAQAFGRTLHKKNNSWEKMMV